MRTPDALDQHGGGGTRVATPVRPGRRKKRFRLVGWPPISGSGGSGGGGGGDGNDDDEPDFDAWDGLPRPGTSELGMTLALLCICTLFLVFLGVYVLLRKSAVEWPPPGAPGPPNGLWVSTAVLLACSATLARGLAAHRRRQRGVLFKTLLASGALGVLFLALQAFLWRGLLVEGLLPSTNGYGAIFYALTGLHAAHILGGLGYLARVVSGVHADRAGFGPETPLRLCGAYWHVMGAIWLVIFFVLIL